MILLETIHTLMIKRFEGLDFSMTWRVDTMSRRLTITFAKPGHYYQSYSDFWTLVELSGFDVCAISEVDISKPCVYIVTPIAGDSHSGEWGPHIANQTGRIHNAHLVHWCLERPSGSGGVGNYAFENRKRIYVRTLDDIWVSDKALASETMLRHVILGSDYGLGEPCDTKLYDFCHMSYAVDRRLRVYDEFTKDRIGWNCWPPERDQILKHSKFALNIHQDQFPFQEPLRFALFAAYGLPILTEEIRDAYPWNESVMNFHSYAGIAGHLKGMLLNDYSRWRDMGMRARDVMCKTYRFKDMVEKVVKETVWME